MFSGRPTEAAKGVFFCYALPGRTVGEDGAETWGSDEARQVRWYFNPLDGGRILESAAAIAGRIRSADDTSRRLKLDRAQLVAARKAVEAHITQGYLRQVQAPIGVKPVLKTWMELN
ncbi:hypothetical protein D3C80_1231420 [compost metagenome]